MRDTGIDQTLSIQQTLLKALLCVNSIFCFFSFCTG